MSGHNYGKHVLFIQWILRLKSYKRNVVEVALCSAWVSMFQTLSCFQSEKFSASQSGDISSSIQSFSSRILRRGIDPTCWGCHYSTETPIYGNPTYSEKKFKELKEVFSWRLSSQRSVIGIVKKRRVRKSSAPWGALDVSTSCGGCFFHRMGSVTMEDLPPAPKEKNIAIGYIAGKSPILIGGNPAEIQHRYQTWWLLKCTSFQIWLFLGIHVSFAGCTSSNGWAFLLSS